MGTNKKIVIISVSFFGILLCIYSQALKAEDSASKSSTTSESLDKNTQPKISDQNEIIKVSFRLKNYLPSGMEQLLKPMIEINSLTAQADDQNKTLLVFGTLKNLIQIEEIITAFDSGEDELRYQIFELKYIDPNKAAEIINKILELRGDKPSKDVFVLPVDEKKWLIAQAPESKDAEAMTQIEKCIQKIDVQDANSRDFEILSVKHNNVSELAVYVNSYFDNMSMNGLDSKMVFIQPLSASNQLLIFGRSELRQLIEKLIAELDMPIGPFETKRFKIRTANPEEIKKKIDELYKGSNSPLSIETVSVVVFPLLRQISVIASATNMEKMEKLINEIEPPIGPEKLRPRVIVLKNSDPNQMAAMLHSVQLDCTPVTGTKKIIIISNSIEAYDVTELLIRELDSLKMAYKPSVIQLNYTDPNEIKKKIDEHYKGSSSQTSDIVRIIAYPSQRQIIIVASTDNSEKIRLLIKELDKYKTVN
jgi:type II secretory pathway component GspD/PulD (secretin)